MQMEDYAKIIANQGKGIQGGKEVGPFQSMRYIFTSLENCDAWFTYIKDKFGKLKFEIMYGDNSDYVYNQKSEKGIRSEKFRDNDEL